MGSSYFRKYGGGDISVGTGTICGKKYDKAEDIHNKKRKKIKTKEIDINQFPPGMVPVPINS